MHENWQQLMRTSVTEVDTLFELLELPHQYLEKARLASTLFPFRAPLGFIQKMEKRDINDPLLMQILPLNAEFNLNDKFTSDPVADLSFNSEEGVIHKYQGRVLLIATGACAVHCRYCFRRDFPYQEQIASKKHWTATINYIKNDLTINEVILSGGDPLSLSDHKIKVLLEELNKLEHIKSIRFHTRNPIVLPERVNQSFLDILSASHKKLVFVFHSNHANELDHNTANIVSDLKSIGAYIFNQAVLLKGVNDSADSQIKLSHTLFEHGILPYYLNQLDRVKGATHFLVKDEKALAIHESLKKSLPGYLVPKLVRDLGNDKYKSWL